MKWLFDLIKNYRNKDMQPPTKEELQPVIVKPKLDIELPSDTADWEGIVWHHSSSADHADLDNWASIKTYHTSWRHNGDIMSERKWRKLKRTGVDGRYQRPWSDIGYHAGVEREKGQLVFRLGRSWEKSGAHAGFKGNNTFNEKYLGLCAVGNYDEAAPDEELWEFCLSVSRVIADRFQIPYPNIIGHREVYDRVNKPRAKTCPGELWDMDKFRAEL